MYNSHVDKILYTAYSNNEIIVDVKNNRISPSLGMEWNLVYSNDIDLYDVKHYWFKLALNTWLDLYQIFHAYSLRRSFSFFLDYKNPPTRPATTW